MPGFSDILIDLNQAGFVKSDGRVLGEIEFMIMHYVAGVFRAGID